ncbi:D-erythronate dehydrogenase-like [Bradysia coprophila]|uniref:D-erythronate dehydrogenase-like n=1 Tax=Bradysia coprophila TaxID=38358 RepID=UPI00187DB823|nr:D-erythronate dehydrogenase-like [Bradysia coprophila]
MHILITGAGGFIGQLIASALLNDSQYTVTLAGIVQPKIPGNVKYPQNAKTVTADLSDATCLPSIVTKDLNAVYVLHGIMSSGSEADFELGMQGNVYATMNLLEALRKTCPGVRVIYTSSMAVYGRPIPDVVHNGVIPTPQSSYGAEKIVCETLINDYTRRKFIDGFILRLPSIVVRPGEPTAAASSFLSGMIREPFSGLACIIPIVERSLVSWLCSPRTLVCNLLHTLTIPSDALPSHIRQINLPGIGVSIQEMMDALASVGGDNLLKYLKEENDEKLIPILKSWATAVDNGPALELGYKKDVCFEDIVRDYKNFLLQA